MQYPCVFLQSTNKLQRYLRRYCTTEAEHCNGRMSYHDTMIPFDIVDEADRTYESQDKNNHVEGYPERCSCGYVFVPDDHWQVFTDRLYQKPDGTMIATRDCEPGSMWFMPWLDVKYKPQLEHVLVVKCPGDHIWIVDSEASNCNRKAEIVAGAYPGRLQEDHHCWEIVGTLPLITVRLCSTVPGHPGGGSILFPDFHGMLENGVLRDA